MLPSIQFKPYTYTMLRALTGIIFVTHGAARIFYWSIPGFGEFLNSMGLMIGLPLAWLVAIGEIISGSCLAIGYKVKYCTYFHIIVIVNGIFMVHLPNGWFTVGHGTGGVEYSLLLLTLLIFINSYHGDR